jgi:cellulose synthase/poly-beta-1,6-N-acetylglucosamine synthase-like glycosyltransferase
MIVLDQIYHYLLSLYYSGNIKVFCFIFFPFVLCFEMPYYVMTCLYSIRAWIRQRVQVTQLPNHTPPVTVVITCYNESFEEVLMTVRAISEQIYAGTIQTLIIIDNAAVNQQTVNYAKKLAIKHQKLPNRSFTVIEKLARGGHASSMNLGLKLAKGDVLVTVDADTSIDNQTIARSAIHFLDPNVVALSGAVRVRNIKDSILTRLQAIEYMVGIQLARYGLTELNVTNNISGAFGVFKTKFLRQIGGWLNGSAEDFDLTFRLHAYISQYPHLKIVHEPFAIAWTAAPKTWNRLFKQRLRWDGDLFYIYVRRHWRKFNPSLLHKGRLFFFVWYGLYHQIALPFVIVLYSLVLLLKFNIAACIAIACIVYLYYLLVELFMYGLFLILVSERVKHDLYLSGWLFLVPIYQQILRFAAAIFIVNEMLFKGHQDSTMAPWWVIKKTK